MKTEGGTTEQKRRAGEAAAAHVEDGMVVGLGTGSTAAHAIRALGSTVDGGCEIHGVATSFASKMLAREVGIPLRSLDTVEELDLTIDGADQVVTETGACIKGGGAAHAREKIVASISSELFIVADPSKVTETLDRSVPIEVLPAARTSVTAALTKHGGTATLREATKKDGPVVTDNGNFVLDCSFGAIGNPRSLGETLSSIPGVVEHGLFTGLATAVYVGTAKDVTCYEIDR